MTSEDVLESSDSTGYVGKPPFRVNGQQYFDGIGLNLVDGTDFPGDSHDIAVPPGYTQLVVAIGLDDESSAEAAFHVTLSRSTTDEVLWEGDIGLEQVQAVTVNVTGMTRVRLFGTGLHRKYNNARGEVVITGEFRP